MSAPLNRLVGAGLLGLGLLIGGYAGSQESQQLTDRRPMCASCHHSSLDLEDQEVEAPHSVEFDSQCHSCHVLPVKEFLSYGSQRLTGQIPAGLADMENPAVGGQTCMECHLGRVRGALACERCHEDGGLEVQLTQRCETCHDDREPLHPHGDQDCRDCHVETMLDNSARFDLLMHQKLGNGSLDEE